MLKSAAEVLVRGASLPIVLLTLSNPISIAHAQQKCANPAGKKYISKAQYYAPDATRAQGILVSFGAVRVPVPDRRPECLPLPVRLNNPGALKTPNAGPWNGQIAKDLKGHAVFRTTGAGVAAWTLWMERRVQDGRNTAFKLMSMYAPPDDCIGSVKKIKNAQGQWVCPPGYPLNPTREYADRVAAAVNKKADDILFTSRPSCPQNRDAAFAMLEAIMKFENGAFCGKNGCSVERTLFEAAMDTHGHAGCG
jgi:hypothetical protein